MNSNNGNLGHSTAAALFDLGSGCTLQFGDPSNATFSGAISGAANNVLLYQGAGTASLAGASSFSGTVTVAGNNGFGELQVSADQALGNSSNPVLVEGLSTFGANASFSSTRAFTFGTSSSDGGSSGRCRHEHNADPQRAGQQPRNHDQGRPGYAGPHQQCE